MTVAAVLLAGALVLRLAPEFNDALSGPPRYMEAFTRVMAKETAKTLREEFPVLMTEGENADCTRVGDSFDYDDAYYVLTFSETKRSVCFTVYAVTLQGSGPAVTTLDPSMGVNYGRAVKGPVRAIPMHRSLTVLSPEYLAPMHWRAKVDAALGLTKAGKAQRVNSPSARFIGDANITVNFEEVRREVAKRHTLVNGALAALALLSGCVLGLSLLKLRRVYAESVCLFGRYEAGLGPGKFLTWDLAVAGQEAIAQYEQKREAALATARLEHEKEEISRRLGGLLPSVQDESQRERVEGVLERQEMEEMQMLLDELAPQAAQATPEERLHLLLETLKDYCSEEEQREAEGQVLEALRERGFRAARELAVGFHEEFRARYKEMADKETEA